MDFAGFHLRDGCLLSEPDMRGACPIMIVMPDGQAEYVGAPVEEAIYKFLHREFGWQPRRLHEVVATGQQDQVVLQHSCGKCSLLFRCRTFF